MLKTPKTDVVGGRPVGTGQLMRKLLRLGSNILPYLAWLAPFVERAFWPRQNGLPSSAISDLKQHMDVLYSSRQDMTPVLEEQQRRLDRLEQQATELNAAIENLSRDQLDIADQVRAMAGWVRNTAMAGLFLLVLMLLLKGVQMLHGIGH